MNSEYYTGWLTHWGDPYMATANATLVAATLSKILGYKNASVNMYMYHGGTNFGFMNGANTNGTNFMPSVTSYDYDAPLDEAGDPTDKYFLIRDAISQHAPVPSGPLPAPALKGSYGPIAFPQQVSLFAEGVLQPPFTTPIFTSSTYSFERLGLDFGFLLYRTNLTRELNTTSTLAFTPRDRAWVYLDGEYMGIVYRGSNDTITLPPQMNTSSVLDILVENMGRINYGTFLMDPKGLGSGVICDFFFVYDWTAYPLPLNNLDALPYGARTNGNGPSFFRGTFNINGPVLDTYFNMQGWSKGNVFVNGFNLGRYWWVGPQLSLYVPAPLLRSGVNEVIVFETEGTQSKFITSQAKPEYSLNSTAVHLNR